MGRLEAAAFVNRKRWRRRRALVMHAAWVAGASTRMLADALDVSPALAKLVIRRVREEAPSSGRGGKALEDEAYKAWLAAEVAKTSRGRANG